MEKNHTQVWKNCLAIIKDNIEPRSYQTWFEPIKALKLEKSILTIQVPTIFFYEFLEEHYVDLLRKTIKREIGAAAKLEYSVVVDNSSDRPYTTNIPSNRTNAEVHKQNVNEANSLHRDFKNPFVFPGLQKIEFESQLNPNYSFDNYVEGDCNKLARAAGLAVSEKPGGTSFNPLMIYGNSGLGKTHLINAIGNEIKAKFPDKLVIYVSCNKFIQQFMDALANKNINSFVHFYQSMDVIVMDDVHDFANKEKSQEIFFHVFNHLHQNGKQIILTSDKMPRDLKGFEERLLSRFKWGLTADVQIPDYETRLEILKKKMYADGIELPTNVVEYLALKIETHTRDLEGAMISMIAHATLNKSQIDINLAKSVLKNFINNVHKEVSIEDIKNIVCEYFEIPVDLVLSKTHKREVVQARQISMYMAKTHTKTSLKTIGQHFGNRHHSTVIHACQQVEDLMDVDKKYESYIKDIKRKLKTN